MPPPPLPSLGKKPHSALHPVAPVVGKLPPKGSRLQLFKAKPRRSKFDHSHDFDMKPGTPEPHMMASHQYVVGASTRSIVDFMSDDGRGDNTDDSSGRLVVAPGTTIITTDKSPPLSKELVALKSIQGRIDNVMHAFDESMAKATTAAFDTNDPLTPLTWKVGEILMATHESLTMASGFNERLFTKDMDEVKVLMSRDSQSVVDDWATESTPAMRKLTNLFHQTVKTLQDMQSADPASRMGPSTTIMPSTKVVHVPTVGLSEDAAKLVQRLQNEKAILMGQLQETSNMYTSIAEVVKEREDDAKRVKTLLHGKVDEITRLKQELFVLNNEQAKRDEQEKSVAHWKEKYTALFTLHQTVDTREREATKMANELAAQVHALTQREAQAQALLQESQALLSAAHDDVAEKAEELARRQSVQLHGIAHEYEHEIKELKAKMKELKQELGESQKQHKKALDRQRTEMKKHFDSVLSAGNHGFTERHLHVDSDSLRSRNSSVPVAHASLAAQHTAPQLHTTSAGHDMHDDDVGDNDDDVRDNDDDDDDETGSSGPNISDDDDDDEREDHDAVGLSGDVGTSYGESGPGTGPPPLQASSLGGIPRSRRQSIQEQNIHKHLSGMINKAFTEGSVAHAMASVVPPSEMLSSPVARRTMALVTRVLLTGNVQSVGKSITMAGPNGLPVQVEVPEGVTVNDDSVLRLKFSGGSCSRRASLKGSLSSHDLTSPADRELGDAEAAFDASMLALDLPVTAAVETNPEMTQDDRVLQLQMRFDAEKAVLKRKFIDSMCLFRQQMIDQYDKKATELVKKHRAEVIRIATVAETKYGKLLDQKEDLLREAKRTIKSLYKSLAVSSDAKTVTQSPQEVSKVKQVLKSTWSLVSAKRMSKRLLSIHQIDLAELCKKIPQTTESDNVSARSESPPSPTHSTPPRSPTPQRPSLEPTAPPIELEPSEPPTPAVATPLPSRTPTPLPTTIELPDDTPPHPDVDISLPDPQPPPPQLRVFEPRPIEPRRTSYVPSEDAAAAVATVATVVARPSMRNCSTQVGDADWGPELAVDGRSGGDAGHATFANYVLEGTGMYNPDIHHARTRVPRSSLQHPPTSGNHEAMMPATPSDDIVDSMLLLPRSVLSHQYNARNGMYTPPPVTKVPTRQAVQQLIENYANTLTSLRENINWNKWQCVLKCLGLKRMEDVLKVDMDTSATTDHALIRLRRRFATKRAAFSQTHEKLQAQQHQAWANCMDAFVCYNSMGDDPSAPSQRRTTPMDVRGTSIINMDCPYDNNPNSMSSPVVMSPRGQGVFPTQPRTAPSHPLGAIASPSDLLQRCKTSSIASQGRHDPAVAKRVLTLASLLPTDISALSMDERQRYLLELNSYMQSPSLPREPTPPHPSTQPSTATATSTSRGGKLRMHFEPSPTTTTIKGIPSQSPFMRRKALESLQKRMLHTKQQYAESTSGCGGTALDQTGRRTKMLHSPPRATIAPHHAAHQSTPRDQT